MSLSLSKSKPPVYQKAYDSSNRVPPEPPLPYPYPNPHYQFPPPPRPRTCFCCLFSTFRKFLITGIIILAIVLALVVAIVLIVVFRPHTPEVYVESAYLAAFDLSSSSSGNLLHNLTTEVSFRNPKEKSSMFFHQLEADGYYDGWWFGWTQLPAPFHLEEHNLTKVVRAELAGEAFVGLGDSRVDLFNRQKREGFFDLGLRLYGRMNYRYKRASIKYNNLKFRVKCQLPAVPLRGNGEFVRTKCKVNLSLW